VECSLSGDHDMDEARRSMVLPALGRFSAVVRCGWRWVLVSMYACEMTKRRKSVSRIITVRSRSLRLASHAVVVLYVNLDTHVRKAHLGLKRGDKRKASSPAVYYGEGLACDGREPHHSSSNAMQQRERRGEVPLHSYYKP
jgi:hypothetical protein